MSEVSPIIAADNPAPDRWRWKTGWGITALFVCSAANLYLAFYMIPLVRRILQDLFDDAQLPMMSRLFLGGRWVFVALACAWPVAGIWISRRPRAVLYVAAILLITLGQAALAFLAFWIPGSD